MVIDILNACINAMQQSSNAARLAKAGKLSECVLAVVIVDFIYIICLISYIIQYKYQISYIRWKEINIFLELWDNNLFELVLNKFYKFYKNLYKI